MGMILLFDRVVDAWEVGIVAAMSSLARNVGCETCPVAAFSIMKNYFDFKALVLFDNYAKIELLFTCHILLLTKGKFGCFCR